MGVQWLSKILFYHVKNSEMRLSRILWVNVERERERANYHSKIAGFLEPHHCVRVIERLFDLSKLCPLVIRQCNGFIPSKFGERERERERERVIKLFKLTTLPFTTETSCYPLKCASTETWSTVSIFYIYHRLVWCTYCHTTQKILLKCADSEEDNIN